MANLQIGNIETYVRRLLSEIIADTGTYKAKDSGYLYSGTRIFVENFRADKLIYGGNISAAQSIGVMGIVLGLSLMWFLNRKGKK